MRQHLSVMKSSVGRKVSEVPQGTDIVNLSYVEDGDNEAGYVRVRELGRGIRINLGARRQTFSRRRHHTFVPCDEVPGFARAILALYGSGEKLETAFLFCARTEKQIGSKAMGLF